ncbi:MAG: DUF2126 domain-containing protein [Fimbriiglobus sp.]
MGIHVALNHTTTYSFDRPVTLLPHIVRLRPAPHTRIPIHSYSLKIEPEEQFLNWQQDPYSNYHARLVFPKLATQLKVTVDVVAEMTPINPFDFFLEESAEKFPFTYDDITLKELAPYLETLPITPHVAEVVKEFQREAMPTNDFIVALNQAIQKRVGYVIRLEPGVQEPEETLTLAKGSCRDSSWLLVQVCRHLGLAARFCSGYLIQLIADEKPLDDGPSGPVADFTDLHAWTEVFLPGAGWVGLDPTSGLLAAEGHIPLACTAEPQTAAAITGGFSWPAGAEKPEETFDFQMSVKRIIETPRVTKPYTPEEWNAIQDLGNTIDVDLVAKDARLTMGGEPTFVSIDNRDAAEWNTAALGAHKRNSALTFIKRLRNQFAPNGGFLHFGQGKWYPGESLPRWAFGCYWRKDGVPIWEDETLIGDEAKPRGFGAADAEAFVRKLAELLNITDEHMMAGFEDAWYYMWRERRLPTNVDPLDNKIEEPEERARLAKVFEQGLSKVIGYALPVRRNYVGGPSWETGPWFLRKERLFLVPGDSPMGFRLPLDSIAWEPEGLRQTLIERDPFSPRGPLPSRTELQRLGDPARVLPPEYRGQRSRLPHGPLPPIARFAASNPLSSRIRTVNKLGDFSPHNIVRTAICVEPRNGCLYLFMPPLPFIEDYLELVSAIEATAKILNMPILIEGYKPPHDPRIQLLGVTPDPGVIEVNTPPVATWAELVKNTETIYEEARLSRLCTEKFLHDGRHTGTGGGNHVVLGGETPANSPILRRPDLLRSLVAYWNNHPSLSYLFSGLFIGPTSQHPRPDEARHDSLHELELAFRQVDPNLASPPAWLVDRLFRNLLIDSTGNTHRTEMCIDKLYSPDSSSGRLGLLELRGFEMPPHSEMSCVQQLLLRGMVAAFWGKPYRQPLVRWGTELHDRFMLPHFVEQDFLDVLDELGQWGYRFDPAWFAPHVEFRFPVIGSFQSRGVVVEMRTGIEPWHVLGEDPGPGGTVRYVDSSVERIQLKVRGMTDPRHVLTCNGRRVPLHPTGTKGEYVAGVRYRAWQPPNCLHPTIGVHVPLIVDMYDTWNLRSLGGCTYHVAHPGGRSHETMPVNSREAEGRRLARFFAHGHTPGPVPTPPVEHNPEFPLTLDLRR